MPTPAVRGAQLYMSRFLCSCWKKCQTETAAHSRRKFRFKNKLMSLDASVIELSATIFDWAKYTNRRARSNCICCWITMATCPRSGVVTEGRSYGELNVARDLRLKAGTILAVDRGYNDYVWFGS